MTDGELRRRSLDNLVRAAQEAGPELSQAWFEFGDPDFQGFRDRGDRAWLDLMARLQLPERDRTDAVATALEEEVARMAGDLEPTSAPAVRRAGPVVDEEFRREVMLPERPLGRPDRRLRTWAALAAVFTLVALLIAFVITAPWWLGLPAAMIVLAVLALDAGRRALVARSEIWRELGDTAPPEEPPDDVPPTPAA